MITEQDLYEAIAECQGQRNPNANTCIKLAAYYTILDNMRSASQYSNSAAGEPTNVIMYNSGTEFSQAVNGAKTDEIMSVMDELMTALQAINPRMYTLTLNKIKSMW